ncbi:PTS glucose transporter subunit IIA [Lactiplantibacillus pentosus]|uniref:PTS sugar transporter subunit IIA n=1 Tax=Lactiplantibacillus pentosus TaxID=1589 RepID=UPI00270088FD|nr:PTS glucose transporter subunit IIA [Lactiplantibacillus pentosus]MDO7803718.1 PTS glucose transporter subunit IIA [Lactiplantibacillus pentosus]
MFKLFKTKSQVNICAPVSGKIINLENVKDEVFSTKMMGDGFAIEPMEANNIVSSPVKGKVVSIAETKHAVGVQTNDGKVEILLHIGLDTVNQKGEGFKALIKNGDRIESGQPLIEYDRVLMKKKGYDMVTMVIFTKPLNESIDLVKYEGQNINAGDHILNV